MSATRLRDLIVLLPGIMGSALQKNGRDVWATSGQAAWGVLSSFGRTLNELKLTPGLPDGVSATALLQDAHILPGFIKVDGYSTISRMITESFNIEPGTKSNGYATNFIEFPYDWRQDNRRSAKLLQERVRDGLSRWRKHIGDDDARVIFIAHSMGGLIARYYLEVLEGWSECRALITFGTPFRGSPNALNFLANGYKKLFLDMTETLRSFPSVHQLLPIYECIAVKGKYIRVAEAGGLPGVDPELAADALAFHREIEAKVNQHKANLDYLTNGYVLLPIVGALQPTLQSAVYDGKTIFSSVELPPVVKDLTEGDGTVPRVSAIPIDLSLANQASFVAECHGSLQCNPFVLNDLRARLQQMQADTSNVRLQQELKKAQTAPTPNGFSLEIDDLYTKDEPVILHAKIVNARDDDNAPWAFVERVGQSSGRAPTKFKGVRDNDRWSFHLQGLAAGLYRVQIRSEQDDPLAPRPVQDLFIIEQ